MMLLWLSRVPFEDLEDAPSKVPFEAPSDLAGVPALGGAAFDVGPCFGVVAHS
jgi:hypothetical protein